MMVICFEIDGYESMLPSRYYLLKPVKQPAKLSSPQIFQNAGLLCKVTIMNPGSPQIIQTVSIGGILLSFDQPTLGDRTPYTGSRDSTY